MCCVWTKKNDVFFPLTNEDIIFLYTPEAYNTLHFIPEACRCLGGKVFIDLVGCVLFDFCHYQLFKFWYYFKKKSKVKAAEA